ncbi:cation diffusion facilitator family transporter [Sphingosinithalassobacter sp. CS137]|uniref:cation diffusion facilitator family transporter n=1 Tax=Sphingosinithalassobacter sp. CS137 TaxID=2762748 RepID=UPI00165DD3A1|nr:cation diffusion facilitator family transporter [Sphingosinithalassobacter sp. CS137]
MKRIPAEIEQDVARARRLEWWTLGWQLSIIVILYFVLGSSQALKSAWIEDILGLVPAAVFLIALHWEQKAPDRRMPFGHLRMNSLAFLAAASALVVMGGWLIFDSGMKLLMAEHPTIGPMTIAGERMWAGWPMMAALAYSVVPPVILGRMKQPVAKRIQDKVLYTDALMQKADWMTGLAAIVGIAGVGYGLWWADSAAALLIALDIAHDGLRALRVAAAELADGAPRALDSSDIAEDARALHDHLQARYPGARIRLRETGRYIMAQVHGATPPAERCDPRDFWPEAVPNQWRLASVSFAPDGIDFDHRLG